MSTTRFRGLLDGPGLFEDLEPSGAELDPETLEARRARPCPACEWLTVDDPCERCGATLDDPGPDPDPEAAPRGVGEAAS